MSRQKAKTVKVTAINKSEGFKEKSLPKRTGWVRIHIPDPLNDNVSKCGMVRMIWTHLICIPDYGDSISELIALRVCSNCARQSADEYQLTD